MSDSRADQVLDASGLMCPMPVVKTARAMKAMMPGQVLKVVATDRGAVADIPAWASDTGNELLSSATEGNAFVFFIRKGAPA